MPDAERLRPRRLAPDERRPPRPRRLTQSLTNLQAGFWFLATTVALVGPALAVGVDRIDHAAGRGGVFEGLFISPTSARTILGSIAGSLITIASLTSSLTIVTLQLLSSQYTPRAVRGFLRTRLSQIVFGTFIGIFLYCLLLLVVVRAPGEANEPFVPSLGVVVAIVLAIGGLGLLVLFIHRMAQTIQVSTMAAGLARRTTRAVRDVHPHPYRRAPADDPPSGVDTSDLDAPNDAARDRGALAVTPRRAGYLRTVDHERLVAVAERHDLRITILAAPGEFRTTRGAVATVRGRGGSVPDGVARSVRRCLAMGTERDTDQDPAFGIRQLVDIALRAISPGINDPSTAAACLHHLQDVFELLCERELPAAVVDERSGVARLVARRTTFDEYLEPLTEIARYAVGDARVTGALLDLVAALGATCEAVGADERKARLDALARDLAAPAIADARTAHDEERVAGALRSAASARAVPDSPDAS